MAKRELSNHAHAAKLCRQVCKDLGIKAKVRSSIASMCDAVDITVNDLHPDLMDELKERTKKYQEGRFDGMNDIYEYDNLDGSIPQVKYVQISNRFSDELYSQVWRWLVNDVKISEAEGLSDDYSVVKTSNIRIHNEHVSELVWRFLQNKKHWGLSFWDAKLQSEAEDTKSNSIGIEIENFSTTISEHTHTKKGTQMFIVHFEQSFTRDEFNELRSSAKSQGGWYSRKWGDTPNGFAFPSYQQANEWMESVFNKKATIPVKKESNKPTLKVVSNNAPAKLRKMADNLDKAIESKMADRLTNTPKRMAQYNHSKVEGLKLQRAQQLMRKIADSIESGTLPSELVGITKKQDLINLVSSKLETVMNGYHTYHVCTGVPRNSDPATKAAWELLGDSAQKEESQERKLREAMQAIQFVKIAGYYPTPEKLVDDIINDYAMVEPSHSVLEPSAGCGAFLEGLQRIGFNGELTVCEKNYSLADILEKKGYDVINGDFLSIDPFVKKYDRVLMNPPFENQQDIEHITHALRFLNDGGILAAVCSESVVFRTNKLTENFRALLDKYTHEFISLDAGIFKESGTNVKTQLLIVNK